MRIKNPGLRKFLVTLYCCTALLFGFVALIPLLPAGQFWFIAILGIGFPFLLIAMIAWLIFWSVLRSRWAFLSLGVLLLNVQQLSVNFGFRLKKELVISRPANSFRVLSWNLSKWDERNKEKRGGTSYRPLMQDLIRMQEADVLCLQEFFECHDPAYFEANIPAVKKLGFPYYYFFPSSELFEGKFQYGMAIFSRYPIIDSAKFYIEINPQTEGLCYADIKKPGGIIRVFSMHLESVGFKPKDYENLEGMNDSRGILAKLRNSYSIRTRQVDMASQIINSSPHPVIVAGDLNDVPSSYAYFKMKGDLQDAFLKKGSGLGATFRFISPTLRIDYILASSKFKITQFAKIKVPYSDHYPIVADLQFK